MNLSKLEPADPCDAIALAHAQWPDETAFLCKILDKSDHGLRIAMIGDARQAVLSLGRVHFVEQKDEAPIPVVEIWRGKLPLTRDLDLRLAMLQIDSEVARRH